jgi:hypothetical protein
VNCVSNQDRIIHSHGRQPQPYSVPRRAGFRRMWGGLEYSLKWGNGVCREVKGGVLGFLVVEELPLRAFAECHSPRL